MNPPRQRPRVALIGVSGYGRIHLQLARSFRDAGEIDLIAATVINPEEEAAAVTELAARGCRIHPDFREMLDAHAGEIDLCLIPTGIPFHADMAIAALAAGAHVLVEKPLAGSVAEAERIRTAERSSNRFVAVGFQDLYDGGTREWLQALLAGSIGRLREVRFLGIWPRPPSYYLRNRWAGRLTSGGVAVNDSPLHNAFGHFCLLSALLAGAGLGGDEAEDVFLGRAHCIESFDTAVAVLKSSQGVRLWLGASHVSGPTREPELQVIGEEGRATWTYERDARIACPGGENRSFPLLNQSGARRAMMDAAVRKVFVPETAVCDTPTAIRLTRLIELIQRGAPVTPFPEERVSRGAGDDTPCEVAGLRGALEAAYAQGRPLSEFRLSESPIR